MRLLTVSMLKKLPKFQNCINADAELIGRGMFSCVFDNKDGTVTKFTVDEAGYNWLADRAYGISQLDDENPFKFPIYDDYEIVGDVFIRCKNNPQKSGEYPVYAVRMAKCEPLKLSTLSKPQAHQVRLIRKVVSDSIYLKEHDRKVRISQHAEVAYDLTQSDHYEEMIRTLWYMVGDYDVLPDMLGGGNIMSYNGHPVLIDPVFDLDTRRLAS